jgi:hypothetical protein
MPAQRKPPATEPGPLDFVVTVYNWMDGASEQITGFIEQAGIPSLGVDAHALDYLTRIGRLLDEARSDLVSHLPSGE